MLIGAATDFNTSVPQWIGLILQAGAVGVFLLMFLFRRIITIDELKERLAQKDNEIAAEKRRADDERTRADQERDRADSMAAVLIDRGIPAITEANGLAKESIHALARTSDRHA